MSWIVESLLNDRERIRETGDIESEEFNDLMLVEMAIKTLKESGKLTEEDLQVIYQLGFINLSTTEKYTLSKKRVRLCERIAYYMGDYFTDEGYLNHIQIKYKFSPEQMDALNKFIKSEYKHKIIRKPIND